MFIFGHTGITVAICRKFRKDLDTRKVVIASVAADIIDKPIGLLYSESFGKHTRLAAHTLIACVIIFATAKFVKKREPNSIWYAFAYFFHMILDQMWMPPYSIYIFFWPFLGAVPEHPLRAAERWSRSIHQPYTVAGEIIGLIIWITIIYKNRLYRKNELSHFLNTGTLSR